MIRSIKHIALVLLIATTLSSTAQQTGTPSINDWLRVRNLSTATNLHIHTSTLHLPCRLKAVDADSLTCVQDLQDVVFKRTEIRSIEIAHRTRSAWIGVAIGYLVGTIAVTQATRDSYSDTRNTAITTVALLAIAAGALIGYFSDFTGWTIYRAP